VGRILGIDYGRRRCGLALSDPLKLTAQPYDNWPGNKLESFVEKLGLLIGQQSVELVVVGHPKTMKGLKSRLTAEVERFASALSETIPVPVVLWDERLTSVQAHRILHEMGKQPSRHKEYVDVLAAVLLLQNYLDCLNRKNT
jgi:putative Holliday junction resolvase